MIARGAVAGEAARVGREVAARWAGEVDRDVRFPAEAVAELRSTGLLGVLVPPGWGGCGAGLAEVSAAVAALAGQCASTGLVFAMHQIQVLNVVPYDDGVVV